MTEATQYTSLLEDSRRHAIDRAPGGLAVPGAGWVPTPERFRDPASRVVMRVWVDPADQSRHYVPEPDA